MDIYEHEASKIHDIHHTGTTRDEELWVKMKAFIFCSSSGLA